MANAVSRAQSKSASVPTARPFFGLLDAVLVTDPEYAFDGAIAREAAAAAWMWIVRDVAADLIDPAVTDADPNAAPALTLLIPELLTRANRAIASAATSREIDHRLRTQLGGDHNFARLPTVLLALKCRPALEKAQTFGRAANGIHDDAALAMALQSLPLGDRAVSALLFQATVGQVAMPSRLVTAAIRLAGGASETALSRAGFAPLVDALLAHAQEQIPALAQYGAFADVDLLCRAIDRFHRLTKGIHGNIDLGRNSRWAMVMAALTKHVSSLLEPRLREVVPDVSRAMRRPREGADRVDADQLLQALNGIYLLATIRDARDSLALNALFDQTWTQVGQAVEMHVQRSLEALRHHPADAANAARLDAGIKMAELRFGAEYAEVLRRARDSAVRR